MEVITALRIELAEELATLPESLHSGFPDLAVDFLYTVFKESAGEPLKRPPASALEEARAAAAAARAARDPPEYPSEEKLAAARAFMDKIERQAAELEANVAPPASRLKTLLAHRDAATVGDTCGTAPCSLIQCRRCQKVMYRSVVQEHLLVCKEAPAPSLSEWDHCPSELTGSKNDGGRQQTGKRKGSTAMLPPIKSRLSKGSTRNGNDASNDPFLMHPPLSPVLAAAAASKQERSAGGRTKRKYLTFHPGQDLGEPLELNASPRAQVQGPSKPIRLARQNSEPHLQTLKGSEEHIDEQNVAQQVAQQQPIASPAPAPAALVQAQVPPRVHPMLQHQLQPQRYSQLQQQQQRAQVQQIQQQQARQQQQPAQQQQQHQIYSLTPEQQQHLLAQYRAQQWLQQSAAATAATAASGGQQQQQQQQGQQHIMMMVPTMQAAMMNRSPNLAMQQGQPYTSGVAAPAQQHHQQVAQQHPQQVTYIPTQQWQMGGGGTVQYYPGGAPVLQPLTAGSVQMQQQTATYLPMMGGHLVQAQAYQPPHA